MKEYYITYVCPLCNTQIRYGSPIRVPDTVDIQVYIKTLQIGKTIPAYIQHNCKNGSVGIAIFAGLVPKCQ